MSFSKFITLLLFFVISCVCFGSSSIALTSKVVAVVNKTPITNIDIERRKALLISMGLLTHIQEQSDDNIITLLVEETLLLQNAQEHKIEVEPEDLNANWKALSSANNLSVHALQSQMKEAGINLAEFEKYIKSQIVQAKIIKYIIEPQIQLTENELQELMLQNNKNKSKNDMEHELLRKRLQFKIAKYINDLYDESYILVKK